MGKTKTDTVCIIHGNLPSKWKPINLHESSSQSKQDFLMDIDQQFTKMNFEENPKKLLS